MRAAVAVVVALAATGCASRSTMYEWGRYDESLYQHYKNPQDREAFVESLAISIREAEVEGRRVPPGLYAELGYALFEEGQTKEAVAYFQKEKAKWPESRVLMEKMVRNAEQRGARAPAATKGPARAVEKTR